MKLGRAVFSQCKRRRNILYAELLLESLLEFLMVKLFQTHVQTFLEAALLYFNVEPFMDNDCLCNKSGSSTLRRGGGQKGNKFVANTFVHGCRTRYFRGLCQVSACFARRVWRIRTESQVPSLTKFSSPCKPTGVC